MVERLSLAAHYHASFVRYVGRMHRVPVNRRDPEFLLIGELNVAISLQVFAVKCQPQPRLKFDFLFRQFRHNSAGVAPADQRCENQRRHEDGPLHQSFLRNELEIVGVSNELIWSGLCPVNVACCGLRPSVGITSPPSFRTSPTVVTGNSSTVGSSSIFCVSCVS